MEDRNVNKALRLLENSHKGRILPITDEIFEVHLEKHPEISKASNGILEEEEVQNVHLVIDDSIDSEMVRDVIKKKSASASLLGLDGDSSCQLLISEKVGKFSKRFEKSI